MAEPGHREPAPEPLRRVQQFINSIDIEEGRDQLADPAGLAAWLAEHGLDAGVKQLNAADLRAVVLLRDALRELAAANNGLAADAAKAAVTINHAAARSRLVPVLGDDGDTHLKPAAGGLSGALGAILADVHKGIANGTWRRLKACERGHCRWVFYDASRNRSGRWCSMAVCGSREKSRRAYHRSRTTDD